MPQDLILLVVSIVGVSGLVGLIALLFGTREQNLGEESAVRLYLSKVAPDFSPEEVLIGDAGRAALAMNAREDLAVVKAMGDKFMVRTFPRRLASIKIKPIKTGVQFIIQTGDIGLGAFKLKVAEKKAAARWVGILGEDHRDSETTARTTTA